MSRKINIGATISLDGEKEYRQAITGVNKSMSVLKSELKAVSAEFQGNANSIEALRTKNDVLAKQQTEQEKKLQLLRGALEGATKQYGENSKQAQDWQIKINNAYADLTKLDRELESNRKYLKEAEQSTDKTAKSIDEFGKEVKQAKEETLTFGDVLKANIAGDAVVAGVKAFADAIKGVASTAVDLVKNTAAYADGILTMSTNTGISTDRLQELKYMAELTDTSLETITSTMARNIRSMDGAKKGTEEYVQAYRTLGVEITDINGQLLDNEQVFWRSIDALGRMANETERDALAMQLFGRSAQDLNSLIAQGSDGVSKFAQEARDMGAVLTNDTLKSLGETDDALQRMYQQLEITKRQFGIELAPAMTEGLSVITKKMGEVDEEFADFAKGAMSNVVDGFVWMIDNADKIEAGLKGIGAAIITKKTADGVLYAVNAYKTLTTATQTATTAQIAFNTVSKANVYIALASAIIGVVTAIYSLTKSNKEATEEVSKLSDETQKLIDKSKALREEVEKKTESWKKETDSIREQYGTIGILADKLYDLADKEKKTNSEKTQMVALVNQLNNLMPNLNLSINEQTGLLSMQRRELENLISKQEEYYLIQAAEGKYGDIAKQKMQAEMELDELIERRTKKNLEIQQLQFRLANMGGVEGQKADIFNKNKILIDTTNESLQKSREELSALESEIKSWQGSLSDAEMQWEKNSAYIDKYSASLGMAGDSVEVFSKRYEEALQKQTSAEVGTLEDRIEKINNLYDAAGKELRNRLRAEERAFEKSQQSKVEIVQKATDQELKTLEKAHQKKLDLINQEYMEKMKNVDEDRYNELKAVQDQIDAINNQTEAEDRALKLREEAEKKAELKARIETAKTAEERLEAQKDLAKYEEELARDRLKGERKLQINILDTQKETINKSFDAKITSLKEEQKKEEEKAKTLYENDKKAIEERRKLKLDELKEEQAIEKDSFKDRQDEHIKFLSKQKDLALKNAKEIYEDDLKQFKLNSALKYKEVISSEEKMKEEMRKYANNAIYNEVDTVNASKILNSNSVSEMMKYYNPSSLIQSAGAQSAPMNYDLFEDAMSAALKKMNLKVELNGRLVGQIVDERIRYNLR